MQCEQGTQGAQCEQRKNGVHTVCEQRRFGLHRSVSEDRGAVGREDGVTQCEQGDRESQ